MRMLTLLALSALLAVPAVAEAPVEARFWKVPWADTRPRDPAVADDGRIWFVGQTGDYVAVLDPGTAEFQRFDLAAGAGPHNLILGEDGMVWYAGNRARHIGRMDPGTGAIERIATLDPGTMALEEVPLPRAAARTRRIAIGRDGGIWYVDYSGGYLGRLDPGTRQVREWPMPSGAKSRPYAMAVDGRGWLWTAESGPQPNRMVAFDPATETFTVGLELTEAGGAVRHMVYDAKRRALWFGTDTGFIGRVMTGEKP